ncbi:helix-turn-helix domain-containing protein [Brochothrix campestris]|uniref:helix-turn-helix domain-containing protein n=1 Tax=Brochothrix campestris TaxID=2757 RepID=UPI0038D01226
MHKLLDKEERNTLTCLEYFSKERTLKTHNIQSMMDELQWTRRSLVKNIDFLQSEITAQQWENYLTLHLTATTIEVELSHLFSIDFFANHYIIQSVPFQFCLEIFNGDFESLKMFTEKNFLSKPTMYRKINVLKKVLADFEITVDLADERRFIGEEHQIRYFFYCLFSDAYPYTTVFTHSLDIELLNPLMEELIVLHPRMTYTSVLKIRTFIAITLTRIQQQHIIDAASSLPTDCDSIILPKKNITTWFSPSLQTYHLTTDQVDSELNGLHFMLSTLNIYPMSYFETAHVPSFLYDSEFTRNAETLLMHYCAFFSLALTTNEYSYLLSNLTAINRHMLHVKGSQHNSRIQLNLEIIGKSHPYIYQACLAFYDYLEKKLTITLSEPIKIQYFLLLRESLDRLYPPLTVCVLSKITDAQQAFLKKNIKKLSSVKLVFAQFPDANVDLYIADFKIKQLEKRYPEADFHYWSSIPSEFEWNLLTETLKECYHQKAFVLPYSQK